MHNVPLPQLDVEAKSIDEKQTTTNEMGMSVQAKSTDEKQTATDEVGHHCRVVDDNAYTVNLFMMSKDRDTNFYLRGPWAYRMRSEEGQNLEGGLGLANLCSPIQTYITGKSTLRCTHP